MSVNLLTSPNSFSIQANNLKSTTTVTLAALTTVQKNLISTHSAGTMVYDTTIGGISYYDGTTWQTISHV